MAPKRSNDDLLARPYKTSMKIATLDESLHCTWESSSPSDPKNVIWKEIQIREYSRTVGDNPSCSSGPPLTIDWEFNPKILVMSVDGYERRRPPRKSQFEMVLPREDRQEMLMEEWRISQSQIASAVRANIKAKNQRRRTVNNLGKMTGLEEMVESCARKFKRLITFKKSSSRQVKEMTKKSQAADAQKREIWNKMGPPKKPPPPPTPPPRDDYSPPPHRSGRERDRERDHHHHRSHQQGRDQYGHHGGGGRSRGDSRDPGYQHHHGGGKNSPPPNRQQYYDDGPRSDRDRRQYYDDNNKGYDDRNRHPSERQGDRRNPDYRQGRSGSDPRYSDSRRNGEHYQSGGGSSSRPSGSDRDRDRDHQRYAGREKDQRQRSERRSRGGDDGRREDDWRPRGDERRSNGRRDEERRSRGQEQEHRPRDNGERERERERKQQPTSSSFSMDEDDEYFGGKRSNQQRFPANEAALPEYAPNSEYR